MNTQQVPAYDIHQDPTITNFFAMITSMDLLTVKIIGTDKNESVLYALQEMCEEKDITFARLCLIKPTRNVHALLY